MTTPPTPPQTIGPYFGPALRPLGGSGAVTLRGRVLDGDGTGVPDALLEFWPPFVRVATDDDGGYAARVPLPLAPPYLAVCVHARGLPRPLFTRAYFADPPDDPLLSALPPTRRAMLRAAPGPSAHRFDIRLSGDNETVFLAF
ncbi:protocatechuate 3,4-dioxygenase subunit alpha [Streptomyces sp. AV19]|uniref:protocatechuate 3,4-dioxygenase subunit alpha n=1 Tax=Streptomyces sp. AV19 TaxID=2793068 RepID=UPI0018FEB2A8|nr:protocatechuate 3,4-dioxygenase subunit alpha [Streptomyces sp. AV19]MBH1938468.1 protocatechuate 3,4-dioxygenase subunit alpha [Streptomyces sp. AV19]MDG4535116.1 protocatechuate 3,4-dioxygenase subunit alpha [Streptomyces sp. AV19]